MRILTLLVLFFTFLQATCGCGGCPYNKKGSCPNCPRCKSCPNCPGCKKAQSNPDQSDANTGSKQATPAEEYSDTD